MRIGPFEIRKLPGRPPSHEATRLCPGRATTWRAARQSQNDILRLDDAAVRGALAVADTTPWWLAVHQVIDEMEAETIQSARAATLEPNECAAHTQSGEALDLLRKRLIRFREEGIKGNSDTRKSGNAEMRR